METCKLPSAEKQEESEQEQPADDQDRPASTTAGPIPVPAGAAIWLVANIPAGQGTLAEVLVNGMDPFGLLLGLNGVIPATTPSGCRRE